MLLVGEGSGKIVFEYVVSVEVFQMENPYLEHKFSPMSLQEECSMRLGTGGRMI